MSDRPRPISAHPPHLLDEWEIRFGVAGAAQVATTLVVCALDLPRADAFGVLLAATVVLGAAVPPLAAGGLGLVCWALDTGFVVNSYGQLTLAAGDLRLLAIAVVGAAVLPLLVRHRSIRPARAIRAGPYDRAAGRSARPHQR